MRFAYASRQETLTNAKKLHNSKETFMKLFITGGAGYLGTEVIRRLIAEPGDIAEIVVYDNFSRGNYGLFTQPELAGKGQIRVIEGDLLDSRKLRATMSGADVVLHLAARVSTPYASDSAHTYDQINHWGTAELVYAIEDAPRPPALIHLSSTSVYGFADQEVDESIPPVPNSSYGMSKFRAEEQVRRLMDKRVSRTVILRTGNVFGYSPSMRFEAVINRFVFEAKYLRRISVHGKGEQVRPFIAVSDVARVIESAIRGKLADGLYNVAAENVAVGDIAALLRRIYPDLEVQALDRHVRHGSLRLAANPKITKILKERPGKIADRIRELAKTLSFR